jgi:AcrR family transcriptional regulator
MAQKKSNVLQPRKLPQQARSKATLEAVLEATLQVLLREGAQRLTTTRVAERAGVSVGTLYQYHPNKHALVFALLERHLNGLTEAVEKACKEQREQTAGAMAATVARAFVEAKTDNILESRALYALAPEMGSSGLYAQVAKRIHRATVSMLETACDRSFDDTKVVAFTLLSAISGTTRSLLEAPGSSVMHAAVPAQLEALCRAYVDGAGRPTASSAVGHRSTLRSRRRSKAGKGRERVRPRS